MPTSNGSDNRYLTYTYTDDNLVASINAPAPPGQSGRVTAEAHLYDADGKQVSQTDANSVQQTTAYTLDELMSTVTGEPAENGNVTHVTQYQYDGNGNQTQLTDPMGNVSTAAYYADNTKQYTQDGAGDRTTYTYDNAGNPTQVLSPSGYAKDSTNPGGTPTVNTYTQDNLLLASKVPVATNGTSFRLTTYSYDDGGRKVSQHVQLVNGSGGLISDGGSQSFTYYNDDRLNTQTGRNGETIATAYDAAGNKTSAVDSTSASTVTATYYADSLARSVNDGQRTTESAYDGLDSPAVEEELDDGTSTKYATTYTYGDDELPSAMTSQAVQTGSTTWTYDPGGRPLLETEPNGMLVSWTFWTDNTLDSYRVFKNDGITALQEWEYNYNNDYQKQGQLVFNNGAYEDSYNFIYDSAGRIQTWTDYTSNGPKQTTYNWDHDGNRTQIAGPTTTTTYAYNSDDTVNTDSSPSATYAYTTAGDLSSDGCFNYFYDGFDRLAQATPAASPPSGCTVPPAATYTYDGLDRQISHNEGTGATGVHYQGTSQSVLMETSSAGSDTPYELDPAGVPQGLTKESTGTTQYLFTDGFASVTAAIGTLQVVRCSVRFDPFGVPVGAQSSSNACFSGSTPDDLLFQSARQDPTTGDYQFGSRLYDPAKASFLTPDSYRSGQSATNVSAGIDPMTRNTYSYVNGDPINLSDPTGHMYSCGTNCPVGGADHQTTTQQQNYSHYAEDQPVVSLGIHGRVALPNPVNNPTYAALEAAEIARENAIELAALVQQTDHSCGWGVSAWANCFSDAWDSASAALHGAGGLVTAIGKDLSAAGASLIRTAEDAIRAAGELAAYADRLVVGIAAAAGSWAASRIGGVIGAAGRTLSSAGEAAETGGFAITGVGAVIPGLVTGVKEGLSGRKDLPWYQRAFHAFVGAVVTTGTTLGGAVAGEAAGLGASGACGPAAEACALIFAPLGGIAGGTAGAFAGEKLSDFIDEHVWD